MPDLVLIGTARRSCQPATPVHPFLAEVEDTLATADLLPAGRTAVIAVSGGLDSMLLLRVLADLRPRHGATLVAAHFHHQLRGAEADADEQGVAEAAAQLRVRFVTGTADVRRETAPGESPEAAARRLRHAFLARTARALGADRIATAHHADDQAELLLLRLLRGSAAAGLAGMTLRGPSPADPGLRMIRPFLRVARARLAAAARDLDLAWREDRSNLDLQFMRNRVRHELVPFLTARFQPSLLPVLQRVQSLLGEQALAIEHLARDWLRTADRHPWETLPVALQRDVLRLQLLDAGIPPGFDLIETLRRHPDVPLQIDPLRRVQTDRHGTLHSLPPAARLAPFNFDESTVDLSGPSGNCRFGGLTLHWQRESGTDTCLPAAHNTGRECLDAEALGPTVRLRHWRPGDRFRPIGMPAAAKLQDLFTHARIPPDLRRQLVLAETADGDLFWVEGLRLGERAKLTRATRHRLAWSWTRTAAPPGAIPGP